jgi:hypothetical protein
LITPRCCCCETHNAHALRAPKHGGRNRNGATVPVPRPFTFTFTFICQHGKTHNHRPRGYTTWRAQTPVPRRFGRLVLGIQRWASAVCHRCRRLGGRACADARRRVARRSRLHRFHRLRPRLSRRDFRHHGAKWHLQHGCSGQGLGRCTGRGWKPSLAARRCPGLLLHGRRSSHAVRRKTDLLLSESLLAYDSGGLEPRRAAWAQGISCSY